MTADMHLFPPRMPRGPPPLLEGGLADRMGNTPPSHNCARNWGQDGVIVNSVSPWKQVSGLVWEGLSRLG